MDGALSSTMSVMREPRGGVRKPIVAVATPSWTGPSPLSGARLAPAAVRMITVDGAQEGIVAIACPPPCVTCWRAT